MAFDPDAYLDASGGGATTAPAVASATPGFNPDAYLAQSDTVKTGGILPNFAAGFEEGVTGGLDTLDKAINPYRKVADIINAIPRSQTLSGLITGEKAASPLPVADQGFYNHLLGYLGLNPDDVAAKTLPEKIARWSGVGATAALVPEGGAETLLARGAQAGARALTGAAANVTGGAAASSLPAGTPDPVRNAVGLFASLAAGIPFSAGLSAISQVPGSVSRATQLARASSYPEMAEQLAGRVLSENATNPQTVKDLLAAQANVGAGAGLPGAPEVIAGSQPTTFQATGDLGLGSLERAVATKNPELFRARDAEQNAARLTALGGIQEGANPTAVADYFRGQLRDLDTQTAQNIAQRINQGRASVAALGGEQTPETMGQNIRDAVVGAESATRSNESALWDAIDPKGDLTGNVTATANAAKRIVGEMRPTEKPMDGEERAIFQQASQLPTIVSTRDLVALRSRVSTAMQEELRNGRTPIYRRLVMLRGAIQDNLANTISDQATKDAEQVAAGQMSPEDQITARIASWRQNWEAQRAAQAGTSGTAGVGGPAGTGAASTIGTGGTGLPGGLPGASGTAGLPGNAPTFDAAAAARLALATAATKARARAFPNYGPVGQVLQKAGASDVFRLQDAGVPAKFFHPGPTGFQDAQSFLNALTHGAEVGAANPADAQAAVQAAQDRGTAMLADAAASSLRRSAMTDDGAVDPDRFAAWYNRHQDALRVLPQNVRDQFANALRAGRAVAEATNQRATAMKDFQSGKVTQLLGAQTPGDVSKIVGQVFSSPRPAAMMKGIADAVANDPDARAGLRQAVVDHIANRFISNTEAATSGENAIKADAFQTFVKNNREALSQVFKPAELDTLNAIADDIRQSLRSRNAVRIPGQSNTAQDLAAMAKQSSILGRLVRGAVGAGAGLLHFGPIGAVAGFVGAQTMDALRDAGIQNVDKLVTQAMLDPALARRLLEKVPAGPMTAAKDSILAKAIRRSLYATIPLAGNMKQ